MIKRIVAAPDSFKGSLTAKEAAEAMEAGIKRYDNSIEVVKVPMADGGEGTVQSMVDATGGHMISVTVKGPMLSEVEAFYGILGDGSTAVIEMAAASGLPLLKDSEKDILKTLLNIQNITLNVINLIEYIPHKNQNML